MFSIFGSKRAAPIQRENPFNDITWNKDRNLFLDSAEKVAHDILGSEDYDSHHCHCIGRVKVRHFWTWWPMTPFYYYDPYPYRGRPVYVDSRRDSDESARWLIGIAAAILGGYAIFKMADAIQRRDEASEELLENWEFNRKLCVYERSILNIPHLDNIKQIVQLKHRIFSQIKSNATWDLGLRISLVAASALTLVGAIAASGGLILTGISVGLATGAIMLCRWTADRTARYLAQDARLIRHHLYTITTE